MHILNNIVIEGSKGKPIVLDVFFEQSKQPKPIIIFAHGFKGFKDWGPWNKVATKFAEDGFVFVKFNFSHNGTTENRPDNLEDLDAFGQNNFSFELDDLGYVMDWLLGPHSFFENAEIDPARLNLLGHSRGGSIALIKGASDSRIKKVVTLAAVSDFAFNWSDDLKNEWRKNGRITIRNSRTNQDMPLAVQLLEDLENNYDRLDIAASVKKMDIPLLFIHGTADTSVPFSHAEALNSWNQNARLVAIDGANHTFGTSHPWIRKEITSDLYKAIDATTEFLNN